MSEDSYMKHKITPLLLVGLLGMFTACNGDSIAGTYGFQMGKESSTHFGLFIKLTDNYVTLESQPDVTDKYKQFELSFSMGFSDPEKNESISSIFTLIATMLGQDDGQTISVPGYYYKGKKLPKNGGQELKLGIDFSFIKSVLESVDLDDLTFPNLDPETIEKILYTTYSKGEVTMYIPVGEIDVIYQLYWYGIDLAYDTGNDSFVLTESSYGAHEPGTHPTKEDVEEINKTYASEHQIIAEKTGLDLSTYRDYYTLAMGLIKK